MERPTIDSTRPLWGHPATKRMPKTDIKCSIHRIHAQQWKEYTLSEFKMPNTNKNETLLQITAHCNKNWTLLPKIHHMLQKKWIPLKNKTPITKKNEPPITPLFTSNKNENYSRLTTLHLYKHHLSKLTMHSALFVSVTYLGLTCCSNGSDAPAAPSPSCSCSKLLLLADLKISPVPPSQC